MSPSDIEVLLHYYVSPSPHPRVEAPAVAKAVVRFVHDDIFCVTGETECIGSGFRVTDRGEAFISMLLGTPYPEKKWVDPRNKD